MPQAKRPNSFAALTFALVPGADGITTEAHLLPPGPFRSTDVRPAECAAWQLDAAIAARVIARLAAQKNDTLIDYEHQSLRSKDNGQKVVAAGWIPNKLEWREGKGLYATGIGWTGEAQRMIAAREIRYVSTVFYYAAATGEVLDIVSVALTNTPAIDGLDEIARAAMSRNEYLNAPQTGEDEMDKDQQIAALSSENGTIKTQVAALTAENATIKTQVAALTTENGDLKTKVAAIEKEKSEAALTAEKAKHAELLQAALTDGRLVPAQKPWAEKQSLAALTEYLEATKPIAALARQADGKGDAAGNHGLSDVELATCTRMGVKPEDFAKTKAAQAA